MSLVLVNQGEKQALESFLNGNNLTIRLYTNNKVPAETDTEANYTEAVGLGYVPKALAAGGWTVTAGAPTTATFAQQTWTFTGALGNVYGYYVTRDADGKLQWPERFTDGPYNITTNGDQIVITPTFTGD